MAIPDDFKEFIACLNAHGVEFVVVGGHARAVHGSPRMTADLDVLVRPCRENAIRVLDALREFGFAGVEIAVDDLDKPKKIIQLGVAPVRIDILTCVQGVSWKEVWSGKTPGKLAGVQTFYIGREEFIRNKLAAARPQDLADVEAIGGKISKKGKPEGRKT